MCRLVPQRFDVCSIKGVIGVSDERIYMCMRVNRGYCLTLYDVVCSTLLLRVRDASTEDWICLHIQVQIIIIIIIIIVVVVVVVIIMYTVSQKCPLPFFEYICHKSAFYRLRYLTLSLCVYLVSKGVFIATQLN